jgi:hypothetical protein
MAKFTYRIPPSTTEQTLVVDIPDQTITVKALSPTTELTGGTPPVTTPPVEPPTTGTRKNLIQESLFDTTDLATAIKGWSDEQRIKNGYSLTIVDKTARFELRKTDTPQSESVRTEITHDIPTEFWFGGRLKLENFVSDTGGESFIQVHSGLNAPPLALLLWGTSVEWTITPNDDSGSNRLKSGVLADFNNKWVDIVFHVKFHATAGIFEAWTNGVKIHNFPKIATSSNMGVYLKLGMNKYSWAKGGGTSNVAKRVFYWDSVRIGNALATYDDVKP